MPPLLPPLQLLLLSLLLLLLSNAPSLSSPHHFKS
jgi:hypothetical protein